MIPKLIADPDVCPDASDFTCSYDIAAQTVTLEWVNEATYESIEVWRNDELLDGALGGDSESFVDFNPLSGEEATYRIVATDAGEECPALECAVFAVSDDDILIREGMEWSFFRGIVEPPFDWNQPDFDDGDWDLGPTGIGYGDGDDMTELLDMQRIAGTQDGYLTVFTRHEFEIADAGAIREAVLTMRYDDGVVVYVNAEEVGRANMPAGDVDSLTSASGAAPEPSFADFSIPADLLVDGDNLVAVSVHKHGVHQQ